VERARRLRAGRDGKAGKGADMIRRQLIAAVVVLGLALAPGIARAQSGGPLQQDPLGPIGNVTNQWQRYQPADSFCVQPDVVHYTPGGTGATATGRDPACRRSGFPRRATGLVRIEIGTPSLCPGCRRLFIDFSRIPAENSPPEAYARGHAYYRLASPNPTYTVDPIAHSPNTKNFTNDKLIAPDGSPQEQIAGAFDLHAMEYVTDTAHFVHNQAQGPYYIGPWYLNRQGERIQGVYLDVNVADATRLPVSSLNAIGYQAGFNSGQACPSDDDLFYGGCVDWGGSSAGTVDPYAG
jgi:hypothetical protein